MKTPLYLWSAFLSLFVFFQTTDVLAQKIYLLAFYDPTDKIQKDTFICDVERMKATFQMQGQDRVVVFNEFPQCKADEDTEEILWFGKGIDSAEFNNIFDFVIDALRNCPAESDDALVVFWSGHGVIKDGKHFLAQHNGAKCARNVLLAEAKKVGARLTVLLTDSCAKLSETTFYNPPQYAPAPYFPVTPLFQELFFNYYGTLDVNACSVGERAFSCSVESENRLFNASGGCFSLALTSYDAYIYPFYPEVGNESFVRRALQNIPLDEFSGIGAFDVFAMQTPSWDEILQYVQEMTDYIYQNIRFELENPRASQPRQRIWVIEKPTRIPGRPKPQIETFDDDFVDVENDETVRDSDNFNDFDKLKWSSEATYRPGEGDRIVAINGEEIQNAKEFREKVAESPSTIVLTVVDYISEKKYYLRTTLYPGSYKPRLGLTTDNDPKGGARVVEYRPGYPINRCQHATK